MAAKLKFANAMLCEHVVSGGSGKHTLVNVYSGDILVKEFPARLAMGFYVEHVADRPGGMWISILRGKGEIAKVHVAVVAQGGQLSGVVAVPLFEFIADEETTIEFVAGMDGSAKTPILKKKILLAGGSNDPTVQRQTS